MVRPSKVIAAVFGLAAFSVAIVAGLGAGNPALTVLLHATIAMVLCQVVGVLIGVACEGVIERHVKRYEAEAGVGAGSPASQAAPTAPVRTEPASLPS